MTTIDDPSTTNKAPHVGPTGSVTQWIDYVTTEASELKRTAVSTADSAASAAKSGLSQLISASSAAIQESKGLVQWMKSEYVAYEDFAVNKTKEGILIAAAHPQISFGVAAGLGLVMLKRPRSLIIRNTRRLFMSEESLLSDAEAKVNKLRQSINLLKNESRKLEERALKAEEEVERGRKALVKEGCEIQGKLRYANRIEREAMGLQDLTKELPTRDASQFRSQVSALVSQVKKEKKSLTGAATKIVNHGIAI